MHERTTIVQIGEALLTEATPSHANAEMAAGVQYARASRQARNLSLAEPGPLPSCEASSAVALALGGAVGRYSAPRPKLGGRDRQRRSDEQGWGEVAAGGAVSGSVSCT